MVEGKLDIVKTKSGKLIIVEVKTTTDPGNIQEQYSVALDQLEKYASLIKRYGLKALDEVWSDDDIEAYILIVVKTNLETDLTK